MRESGYIPGFDWVRIIGSILVAMTHCGVFMYFYNNTSQLYQLFSILIPVFFIMSGYLRERSFSRKAVYSQVLKYGTIYLAVNSLAVIYVHINAFVHFGEFSWTGLIVNMFKGFVCRCEDAYQLWFIPALLYPMLLNAFLDKKGRRIVIVISAALIIATEMIGNEALNGEIDNFLASLPLIGKIFYAYELLGMWRHLLIGTLYTTIGFDIDSWRLKPLPLILSAIPVAFLEFHTGHIVISPFLLSLTLFLVVKKLPGHFMYPYHAEISLFSGMMYFLHIFEYIFIKRFITNSIPLTVLLIIVFNLVVTVVVFHFINKGKERGTTAKVY